MRKLANAVALASTVLATPAVARDGSAYVGVGLGPMIVEDMSLDLDTNSLDVPEAIILDHKYGLDAELVAGYDFGMFRVEGEVAWKRPSSSRTQDESVSRKRRSMLVMTPSNGLVVL